MIPDGFFDKRTLDDGKEVLEYKPRYDNTLVVRRPVKETAVKPVIAIPQEEVIDAEPQTLEFFEKAKKSSSKK